MSTFAPIGKIAKELGISRQGLEKMVKKHPEEAPLKNERGLYDVEELKAFYHYRTYGNRCGATRVLKEKVLAERYRYLKAKADEAEARLMAKEVAIEVISEAYAVVMEVLERFSRDIAKTTGVPPATLLKNHAHKFNFLKDFVKSLE